MPDNKNVSKTIRTQQFRVSFANVWKARAPFDGQEPKFSVTMLFAKGADLKEMRMAEKALIKSKWGGEKPKNYMSPFKDGNEKKLEGYKDCIVVEARTKLKPGVVDRSGEDIVEQSEFYSGCYARATVVAFAWSKGGKNGVSFALNNLQKMKDGEAFSGKRNAKDDFDALEELEEDDAETEDFEEDEEDKDDF